MPRSPTSPATFDIPHVGRVAELALLRDWLKEVNDGAGGMQFVAGQSGIGKTRLVQTLTERMARDKWTVAVGHVYPVERGVPFAVWSDALLQLLSGFDPATRTLLTRGGNWLGAICPAFSDAPAEDSESNDGKARLLWNCSQFLMRVAERRPLLLVLENLHLADAESLELLHFVVRQVSGARIGIIGTYNETDLDQNSALREIEQSLLSKQAARLIRLDPLGQEDVERLVAESFAVGNQVSQRMARRIHAWTRGHPFFVEETLKSLVESGRLHQRDGRWLGWEADELHLPKSVRAAVGTRLEVLSPNARTTAGVAAVVGARIHFRELRATSGLADEPLLVALDELCRTGLLVESPATQDGDYQFAHPIIQEVIYHSLAGVRQRRLHAAIARSLEQAPASDTHANVELLAFHFSRAGAESDADAEKAARYLAAAGRDAMARHANRSAADYMNAALERAPASHDAKFVDDLAQVRQRLGEYEAAMSLWERAMTDAESRGDFLHSAGVRRRMGLACYWSGRFEEALSHYDAALASVARAEQTATAGGLSAQARLNRGTCWQSLGKAANAEEDIQAALATAQQLGDNRLLARSHNALLFLHIFIGPPETARIHGERGIVLAEEAGERSVAWSAHYGMAILAGLTGDGKALLRHMERSEALADELQSPLLRLFTDELSMQYAFAAGDWDSGLALAERSIAMARLLTQRNLLPRLLVWASHFYIARGEFDRAKPYLDDAWKDGVVRGAGGRRVDLHTQVTVHSGMATYHLAKGEFDKAIEIGEAGLAVADRAGYVVWATYRLLPVIIEAALWKNDPARALRLRNRMKEECDRLGHTLGLTWVNAADGLLARIQKNHQVAADCLGTAIANLEAIPWVYDAARLRWWLASVMIELDDRDGAVSELKKSHEVCVRLGAAPDVERARRTLKYLGTRLPPKKVVASKELVLGLTSREMDIARLIVARKSNKEISADLGISTRTVTTHIDNMLKKLGVASRGEFADVMRSPLSS